jgi:ELWxxDGT repeat protein
MQIARQVLTTLAACVLLLVVTVPAAAGNPVTLVRDINPGGSSKLTGLTVVGDTLFFAAEDGVHGVELWKSDGTASGTKMVKNIRPGSKSSSPQNLVDVNGTLFFTARDGQHGREWWTSDGTAAGTRMVVDLIAPEPGSNPFGSLNVVLPPVAVGSRLFFFQEHRHFSVWHELYVTDGTAAGTRLLWDDAWYATIPYWSTAVAYNGKLYFVATDDDDGLDRLWVSNGTRSGTKRLAWSPGANEMYVVPVTGQNLYFSTVNGDFNEDPVFRLWKSNGTTAGTRALTSAGELQGAPSDAAYMAGRLYFNAGALWKTNGTAKGTKSILGQPAYFLTALGDQLYFSAGVSNEGLFVWVSDGTAANTEPVVGPFSHWPRQLTAVGNEVSFKVEDFDGGTWQLWATDATPTGAHWVADFVNPHLTTDDGQMGALGRTLYFAADDGDHGVELWSYRTE